MAKARSGKDSDAIALLTSDHAEVKKMFKDFEKLKEKGSDEDKKELVDRICAALTVHALVEEEIFYPAVRDAIDDKDLMDEAEVEHAGAKDLIAQLDSAPPDADLYDAKVIVLGEQIDHHVKEEEGEMFPKVRKSGLDLAELGNQMLSRKGELEAQAELAEASS